MSVEELDRLRKITEGILSKEERGILGVDGDRNSPETELFKQGFLKEAITPLQGKESDSEVAFHFKYADDAQSLYDSALEGGEVVPGEVKLKSISGQHVVIFSSEVVVNKPQVIQNAMLAFEDLMMEGLVKVVGASLNERNTK